MAGLDNRINLGCYGTGNNCTSPVPGTFDDFKIYTRELTPTEILKEYQIDTGTLPPVVSTTTIVSTDVFNRDRYKELELISPISSLKYAYDVQTGTIILPPVDESIKNTPSPETTTQLVATLNEEVTTNTNTINISPETLSLLNPLNYPYTVISPTSINLQLNGVEYLLSLDNYAQFYADLENNNLNTLAKYLNKVNNLSEEIEYTKYYPSSLYEYDSRGYITINIPFNGKVVATIKYSTDTTLPNTLVELNYVHNNYLGTPVVISDINASTSEVIITDVWGVQNTNEYSSARQTPTDISLTGHKLNYNNGLIYAHARYLNNQDKVWLSHDPYSIDSFSNENWLLTPQMQNSYSYATNDPVNKMDPDGKRTYVVPGTFHGEASWNPYCDNSEIYQRVEQAFGEKPVRVMWNGQDNPQSRTEGVNWILNDLKQNPLKEGEQLNLVGHSHGGNMIKEFSNVTPITIDNAIILAAPYREDYEMNMDKVENYVNVYSYFDVVSRFFGGESIKIREMVDQKGLIGPIVMDGGFGGWRDNKATKNVSVTGATFRSLFPNFLAGPHNAVASNGDIWKNYVAPKVKLPEKNKK